MLSPWLAPWSGTTPYKMSSAANRKVPRKMTSRDSGFTLQVWDYWSEYEKSCGIEHKKTKVSDKRRVGSFCQKMINHDNQSEVATLKANILYMITKWRSLLQASSRTTLENCHHLLILSQCERVFYIIHCKT